VLETTYVSPARARWQLSPRDAEQGERYLVFRCGAAFFETPDREPRSRLISDAGRGDENWRISLASVEIRRALFLWPDGFAWSDAHGARLAELESGERIEAELGADGRPTCVFVRGARDQRETYRAITWREDRGRWWPSTMELVVAGQRVWSERVESLETEVRVLDLFFLPPELRAPLGSPAATEVMHADVPPAFVLRRPLPEGARWDAVAAHWRAAVESLPAASPGAWKLSAGATVELAPSGLPSALLLQFSASSGDPPLGLERVRQQTALALAVTRPASDLGEPLARVRAALPKGVVALAAYARFGAEPTLAAPFQLVLPFRAPE
jgi:hypothetical protein